MPTSVSLSTSAVPGPSTPIALDWGSGTPVIWRVTASSSVAVGDFTVQYTLNDIQTTPVSSIYPPTGAVTAVTSVAYWTAVSSGAFTTVPTSGAIGIHFTSSTIFPDGVTGYFPVSPAALRLYSSASSSNALILTVIQGIGG